MGHTKLAKRGVNPKRLTDKMQRFVAEYLVDYNGSRAARAAGYKQPSMVAAKLLKHPLVSKAVGNGRRKQLERLELTRKNIIYHLACCALRDPLDLCDKNGRIVINDMRELPEHIRACIDGIKVKQDFDDDGKVVGQTIELKLVGKQGCIDLAMKHKGLFAAEKHETKHSLDWDALYGADGVPDTIEGKLLELEEGKEGADNE